jgi:DNA-binding Xre family transcriptional regulator
MPVEGIMDYEKLINMACAYKGISQADLAREFGITPSNFNQHIKRESFTREELDRIAKILGCEFQMYFVFPDGPEIGGAMSTSGTGKKKPVPAKASRVKK